MPHMLAQEHMGIVDALRYGTARTQVTLAAALSAIGSSQAILVVTFAGDGVWTLGSNLAIPANVTLWIPPGVTINRSAGVTLTISGSYFSFNHGWQTGPGTTVFNTATTVVYEQGQTETQTLFVIDPQSATPNRPAMSVAGAGATPAIMLYPFRGIHGPSVEWVQAAQTSGTTWQILGLSTGQLQFSRPGASAALTLADITSGAFNGFVAHGLGNLVTPTHVLHMGQDDAFKATTLWTVPSDAQLKVVRRPMTEGLAALLALEDPVWFTWNGKGGTDPTAPEQPGWLAQDNVDKAPYLFRTYEDKLDPSDTEPTTLYSANYSPLVQMLVNAVKELATRVESLEALVGQYRAILHTHQQTGSCGSPLAFTPPAP